MVIRERDKHICRGFNIKNKKIKQRVTLNAVDTRFSILLKNNNFTTVEDEILYKRYVILPTENNIGI